MTDQPLIQVSASPTFNSDIDILITFSPTAKRGLAETLQMRDELQAIFKR